MTHHRNFVWLSGLLAMAVLLLVSSALPLAADVEGQLASVVAPAGQRLRAVGRPVADVLLNAGQLERLANENVELRDEVARLEAELAAVREARLATAQVADLVAAVGEQEGQYVAASVLLHDPAPARDVLLVDRGSADGVALDQPVLGPGATLVGVVTGVEVRAARVRLLSDEGSAVASLVQRSRTPAALAGTGEGLRLEFVPVAASIEPGDLVLTSALGGRLPAGLPIGRVARVTAHPQELFAAIEVEPLTDYRRLEHVLVLTDFLPTVEAAPLVPDPSAIER